MQAVLMTAPGEPEVLELREVQVPILRQDSQMRVRLKAAGVNPIDTKLRRRGTFYPEQMPAILGCDGAGIVEDIGSQVQRFRPGDEVYFCQGGLGAEPGNYAELIVVDERFVASKPTTLTFAEAAAAPLVLITAWESLYDRGRLQPGQRVLIHAGAGGVGHVAVQLAKLKGAEVFTTIGSQQKADFVCALGADRPILYQNTDFVQAVLDWSHGQGVDLALDTIGGDVFTQTFSAVQLYGDVVTLLEPPATTSWKIARNQNLRISLELMLTPMLQGLITAQQQQANILEQCSHLIDQGKLKIHVSRTFPLAEAATAHRLLETGSITGKIALVHPSSGQV
jgi:NADPH2:quinone reductase